MFNWIKKLLGKAEEEVLLWEAIDNMYPQYSVRVTRIKPYTGKLTVFFNGKIIVEKVVDVSYDAKFGPDIADLQTWALDAVAISDDHARSHS